jgi:hypothetical protein
MYLREADLSAVGNRPDLARRVHAHLRPPSESALLTLLAGSRGDRDRGRGRAGINAARGGLSPSAGSETGERDGIPRPVQRS